MPFRLIHSSAGAPDLDMADLEQMLVESRIRSEARGITGVLIFVDGVFLQILGGEKDKVLSLTETIEQDTRHNSLEVFHERHTVDRAFASSSTAHLSPSTYRIAIASRGSPRQKTTRCCL